MNLEKDKDEAPQKPKFDPKKDAEAQEKLVTARIGLLLREPFFGNLATRMTLVNADEWCSTAATDGRRFYYNSDFILSLPLRQLEFLVGHEVLHAVYDHIGRRGSRDPKISNIAADFCVNQDLIDGRVGDKITVVPILYDRKYAGMSYEEVYEDLMENASKQDINDLIKQILDEHLEEEGMDGEDGDGDSDGKGRPRISAAERRQISEELKEAILQAASSTDPGKLPGGVKRLIKDLTEPKIGWKELLEQQVQSTIKSDFTWQRPSRRGWHMDAVLPGMKPGETIDIAVAIDQSGSISAEESRIFLSEIKGIMDSYDEYKIRVWCFDTEVYNDQEFTSDNMEQIEAYEPAGGGGTDFDVNWEYMKEHGIEPKKFIMFTDGYCNVWGDENYCDTVWIIKGNPGCQPPHGVWAHYENA